MASITVTRRDILRTALGTATLGLLAACGGPATPATQAPAAAATQAPAAKPATEPTKPAAAAAPAATTAPAAPAATTAPAASAKAPAAARPTLRLSHWWGDQYKTWIPMIKERTGIDIQEEVTPWGQYYQKVMTQLVGGQAADIVTEDTFWYGDFFKSGALLALDDLIKADSGAGKIDMKKFYFPQDREGGYKGKTYGLTIFLAQDAIVFINEELADKAGVLKEAPVWGSATFDTWKLDKYVDFLKAGTKIRADGTVEQYGLSSVGWGDPGKTLLYSFGGKYFDDDWNYGETVSLLDQPAWEETMQFLKDLVHTHKVAPGPDVVIEGGAFKAKRAMAQATLSTPSISPPSLFPQQYMHMPYAKQKIKTIGGNAISINAKTKYQAEAWEWIRVYLTDPALRESQRFQNAVPSYDPTPIVQAAKDGPEKTINLVNLSRAKGFSTVPANTEGVIEMFRGSGRTGAFATTQINTAFQAIMTGKTPIKEALKEAKTKIDDELKKNP